MTGSYHHPQTMVLADYFQHNGRVLMGRAPNARI